MRKTSFIVVTSLAGSVVVVACGGSSGGGGPTGGVDSGTKGVADSSVVGSGHDTGTGTGPGSGTGSGTGSGSGSGTGTGTGSGSGSGTGADAGTGSGSGSGTGGDGGFPCDTPGQCTGGNICCGRIPITGGSIPNCTQSGITVDCESQTACPSNVAFSCTAGSTEVVHLCQSAADCASEPNGYTECCMFGEAGQAGTIQFCATSLIALGGTNCMM
jgi:hypothetical protein